MNCDRQIGRDYLGENGWQLSDLLPRDAMRIRLKEIGEQWYVYALWAVVSNATPFYVGMGRRLRAICHSDPSARRGNAMKRAAWDRCIAAGGHIHYSLASSGLTQAEALTAERDLIAAIGRRGVGTGPLSNLTAGGEGVLGLDHPKGGTAKLAKPLLAEGSLFPSKHEAATALGVTASCILQRLRSGWPGYCYQGEVPFPCRKGRKSGSESPVSRAVVADGVRHETLAQAAAALGVHPPAIVRRIKRGWPGYYYEEEGQRPQTKPHRKYAVRVHGIEYPSFVAAGNALGVAHQTIRCRTLAGAPGYSCDNPSYSNSK